ncbi:hypothetical protein BJ944DRAFT_244615 [Cunninghamella echinulata]|nr:hypothetical protein BJ944DRAFT_244615 [Cunninghamella echinulata]
MPRNSLRLVVQFNQCLHNHVLKNSSNNIQSPLYAHNITRRSIIPSFYQKAYLSTNITTNNLNKSQHDTSSSSALEDLLMAMDSHKPSQRIISETKYTEIENVLKTRYTVPQLILYLKEKKLSTKGKKKNLIQRIMNDYWTLTTREKELARQITERRNTVQQQFSLKKDEMFFILEDKGHMLKQIEKEQGIKITIDVVNSICTVEASKYHIDKAMANIKEALYLERQSVQLVDFYHQQNQLQTSSKNIQSIFNHISQNVLDDLSSISETHITIDDDKINLAAKSKEIIENAKRKLSIYLTESGLTSKQPLQSPDHTFIQETESLSLMPLHDSASMPFNMKSLGWSRLCNNNMDKSTGLLFYGLDNQGSSSAQLLEPSDPLYIKSLLQSDLVQEENKNISIEAKFGHLLFQNPTIKPNHINLLIPEKAGNFGINEFKDFFQTSKSYRQFFSGNPPRNVRKKLSPLPLNEGFHRRTVKLNYVDSSLLCQLKQTDHHLTSSSYLPSPISRLQLEYIENDDGTLEFNSILGEYKRSTIDILQLKENVDVRLLAKQYTSFDRASLESINYKNMDEKLIQSLRDLTSSCQLLSYSDIECPPFWKLGDNNMTLFDVSFNNESRYQVGSNLVTLQYTEEQENKARRAEMVMTPFKNDEMITNGFDHWEVFWENISNLGRKWVYG